MSAQLAARLYGRAVVNADEVDHRRLYAALWPTLTTLAADIVAAILFGDHGFAVWILFFPHVFVAMAIYGLVDRLTRYQNFDLNHVRGVLNLLIAITTGIASYIAMIHLTDRPMGACVLAGLTAGAASYAYVFPIVMDIRWAWRNRRS